MSDPAERFHARLSEQLQRLSPSAGQRGDSHAAMRDGCDRQCRRRLSGRSRCRAAPLTTETPRRRLSEREIAEILQAEIAARRRAADDYARLGNAAQAANLHEEIGTIQHLTTLLS